MYLLQHWRRQREPRCLWPSTPQRGCPTSTSTTRKSLTARSYRMGWWRNDFWFRSYISMKFFPHKIGWMQPFSSWFTSQIKGAQVCDTESVQWSRHRALHGLPQVHQEDAEADRGNPFQVFSRHLPIKPRTHPPGVWKVCWSSLWSWKATCSLVLQWSNVTSTQR